MAMACIVVSYKKMLAGGKLSPLHTTRSAMRSPQEAISLRRCKFFRTALQFASALPRLMPAIPTASAISQ